MPVKEKRTKTEVERHVFTIRITSLNSFATAKALTHRITQDIKATPGVEYAVNVYQGSYWRNITPRDNE